MGALNHKETHVYCFNRFRSRMFWTILSLCPLVAAGEEPSLTDLLTTELDVSEEQAKGGAGAIFNFAKSKLSGEDFSQIAAAVPGMDKLLGAAPKADALGGMLGNALGGDGGSLAAAAALAGPFSKLGLDEGMVAKFLPIVFSYVRKKGGEKAFGMLNKILG